MRARLFAVSNAPPFRPCLAIPVFDNVRTVGDVVRRAKALGHPVFVIDDGSTDGTAEVLAGIEGLTVWTQPVNRGKGRALAEAFRLADEAGCTHVVTLDADGQHYPEDAPRLLAAAAAQPSALVLGQRDIVRAGARFASRLGNRCSNFWMRVMAGQSLPDTQTGFRVYPLREVRSLFLRTRRFSFEVEVIVKLTWIDVPIVSVPIRVLYQEEGERVSHYRPVVDAFRIGGLYGHLGFLRVSLPETFLQLTTKRRFRELGLRDKLRDGVRSLLLEGHGSTLRVAASVALGLFMGITPFWGFQVPLTLLLAHGLRASKAIAVVAAHVSFPPFIPAILYASLVLGRAIGGADTRITSLELEGADFSYWVVGSFALAALVAAAGFVLTLLVLLGTRHARRKAPA